MINRATADPRVSVTERPDILPKPDASKRSSTDGRPPESTSSVLQVAPMYARCSSSPPASILISAGLLTTIRFEPPRRSASARARVINPTSSSRAPITESRSWTRWPTGKDRLVARASSARTTVSSRRVKPCRMDRRYPHTRGAGMLRQVNLAGGRSSAKSIESVVPYFVAEGPRGKFEQGPRLRTVSARTLQGPLNELTLQLCGPAFHGKVVRLVDRLDRHTLLTEPIGKRLLGQLRSFRENRRLFEHVLQFPDIARPRIGEQKLHRSRRNRGHLHVEPLPQALEQMVCKIRNNLRPLPQGRQMNGNHRQSIIEVLAELTGLHRC